MERHEVNVFYSSDITIEKIEYIHFTELSTPTIVALDSAMIVFGLESYPSRRFCASATPAGIAS